MVASEIELIEVGLVLTTPPTRIQANWSRRFGRNIERLKSGERLRLAEVVRDLTIQAGCDPTSISEGEKRMVAKASKMLAADLQESFDLSEADAESFISDALSNL